MKLNLLSAKDLRTKKPAEIEKYIAELKTNSRELTQQIYTNKEKRTHQLGLIKKAVARAHLVQTELRLNEEGKEQ